MLSLRASSQTGMVIRIVLPIIALNSGRQGLPPLQLGERFGLFILNGFFFNAIPNQLHNLIPQHGDYTDTDGG